MKLTIYYDGQFWVGVFEELDGGKLKAARHVFGSEPYDWDVLDFVNIHMLSCISTATFNVEVKVPTRPANPKRLAREAAHEAKKVGITTFAQEAIKKDIEARKSERQVVSKQMRQDLEKYKRDLKVQKAKAKKRGH